MNQNQQSVLFKVSLATDVQSVAGVLNISGLSGIKKSRISSITQIKSKAEQVQVITVGATSYTPTSNTAYTVELGDTNRTRNGSQEQLKRYTFVTGTVTGVAATDRETISAGLVALINADTSNFVTAVSLGTGSGFTITDAAGYYNPFSQSTRRRLGATTVKVCQNPDDTGFLSTNITTTTPAIYSTGIGANLAASIPVIDGLYGGLMSGYLSTDLAGVSFTTKSTTAASNNLPAVSGQNYDIFVICSLETASAHNQKGQLALVPSVAAIAVDNGTGSATTNLAGFVAFEREMLRHIGDVYSSDPATIAEFFDNTLVSSSVTTGAAPAGTDNVAVASWTGKNILYYNPIGTATILAPIVTASGIPLTLDATTQEGVEISAPNITQSPKEFVVGKTEASFYVRVNVGAGIAATSYKHLSIGFRKKAAFAVDQTAYEAASVATACLGIPLDTGAAPIWNIITGPGAAGALTNTSTAVTPAVSTAHDFLITVDINGVARFYVNGVDKTPLLAATYTFTAGLHLIPFMSGRQAAAASAAPVVLQALFVPSISWRG